MKNYLKKKIKDNPLIYKIIKRILLEFKLIHSKWKWKSLLKKSVIKLELGSGSKKGINGWTTIDIGKSDICWDLRMGIPLPDNSVKKIYSSHLLEHIPFHQLIVFLKECRRVLIDKGEFLVCVPNFRYYIEAYIGKKKFVENEKCFQPALIDTGSSMDQINYMAYMLGEHKYMFDEENLINTLIKAKFSNARLRNFDKSIDLMSRDFESIYALAIK